MGWNHGNMGTIQISNVKELKYNFSLNWHYFFSFKQIFFFPDLFFIFSFRIRFFFELFCLWGKLFFNNREWGRFKNWKYMKSSFCIFIQSSMFVKSFVPIIMLDLEHEKLPFFYRLYWFVPFDIQFGMETNSYPMISMAPLKSWYR